MSNTSPVGRMQPSRPCVVALITFSFRHLEWCWLASNAGLNPHTTSHASQHTYAPPTPNPECGHCSGNQPEFSMGGTQPCCASSHESCISACRVSQYSHTLPTANHEWLMYLCKSGPSKATWLLMRPFGKSELDTPVIEESIGYCLNTNCPRLAGKI